MTKLLPYQREGVDLIHKLKGRCLLADEMGLGKTIQALFYLLESEIRPVIVVCPAGLKLHWRREARRHCNIKVKILNGMRPMRSLLSDGDVFVINYEILHKWVAHLKAYVQPKVIIGDEIHMIANIRAKRTKAFRNVCQKVRHILALSGTPMLNRTIELYPILVTLWPKEFPSIFAYGARYCEPEMHFGQWRFPGSKHLKELHTRLKKLGMIRRTKEQVLKDLPPKRHMLLPMDIEKRKDYLEADDDVVAWLAKQDLAAANRAFKAQRFARFTYLKKYAAELKMKFVIEWLDSWLEESEGKILLGVWHKKIIQRLYLKYPNAVVIDGSKSQKQRQLAEDKIRKDSKTRMLIGQERACGLGLNLPEVTTVCMIEFPWNPGLAQQFIDRCHRLTSKSPVDIYWLFTEGTIEEKLLEIIQKKQKILDKVLDGVPVQESSLTVFDELQRLLRSSKKVPRKTRQV